MEGIMSSKLFSTRQGTIFLGVIAAVVAAVALIVYLKEYRNSVNNNAVSTVLVAKTLIQTGTPGDVIGSNGGKYYGTSDIAKSDITKGAFVDASSLAGQVAVTDIYPGQQLTAADFGPAGGSVTQQLNPDQRAVVVPLGSPQQVGNQIGGGSHVDVWVTLPSGAEKLLYQDVYVLGTSGDNVTFRLSPQQTGRMIYESQNASIWLVLRPTLGSSVKKPPVIHGIGG